MHLLSAVVTACIRKWHAKPALTRRARSQVMHAFENITLNSTLNKAAFVTA